MCRQDPSPSALAKFAASSINVSLAAISAIHASHNVPTPTNDKMVKNAVEGYCNTLGHSFSKYEKLTFGSLISPGSRRLGHPTPDTML